MNSPNFLSVVITTYNRGDALLAVFEGLARQTDRKFQVVIADDGSTVDQQRKIFESPVARHLQAIHVWHPDVGFTASRIRNRGVAASSAPYIVFLDGDCVPEVDFIARHKALAQAGCVVNGSRVLLAPELTDAVLSGHECVVGRSPCYWVVTRMSGRASKLSGVLRLPDGAFRIRHNFSWKGIRSCNMGVWRCDFESVNGFDESFVGWGHEDADFVLRLHHQGVRRKNGFCGTEVYHLWHPEAARVHESLNAQTVRDRAKTNITQPLLGYAQKRINDDAVITRLG
ncbi:MAG: glycosyltransferase family 2 protein [Burkholderiales bacterium]|nr:glycosyltransferase family 2 protein [Burkholderiales bacterium]MBK9345635.1 glycosyltransferase family 2 protein [Burkholderiales bacterium]